MNTKIKMFATIISVIFALPHTSFSQNSFFDRNWNELFSTKDKKNAKYYRKIEKVSGGYLQSDFYVDKKRTPASVKLYANEALNRPIGKHITYYRNSRIKSEGKYQQGLKSGPWFYFWPNGKVREQGEFVQDLKAGQWIRYRKDGSLWTKESYKDNLPHGTHEEYWEDETIRATLQYQDGYVHGEMKTYHPNGQVARIEKYEQGKAMEKNCFTASGADTTYFPYFVSPRFPGCEEQYTRVSALRKCSQTKMFEFIVDKLEYPDAARIYGKQGTAILCFTVNEKGELKDPFFLEDVSEEIASSCLKMFYKFPDWIPGKKEGNIEKIHFEIPLLFELN